MSLVNYLPFKTAPSLLFLAASFLCGGSAAFAEDIKVEGRLIWGTNDEKSQKPKHEPVDEETAKKLRKIFTWKNYFLENKQVAAIPSRSSGKLKMSKDCEIEITELPGAPVEVKVIGKGKPVNTTTKSLNHGEWFIIGGDDKNECAWFVIISRL